VSIAEGIERSWIRKELQAPVGDPTYLKFRTGREW